MSIFDEMLMAYADGEFDQPAFKAERAGVAAALAAAPELAAVIEQHRALRARLGLLHVAVLDEPVPDRLLAAIRSAPVASPAASSITNLDQVRAAKSAAQSAAKSTARVKVQWVLRPWGALAASVAAAVVAIYIANSWSSGPLSSSGGRMTAQGSLEEALSHRSRR